MRNRLGGRDVGFGGEAVPVHEREAVAERGNALGTQESGVARTEDSDIGRPDERQHGGKLGRQEASAIPRANASALSAASPVDDCAGRYASSCPSTNNRPIRSLVFAPARHPSSRGQSPPMTSGKCPSPKIEVTASRTRVTIAINP